MAASGQSRIYREHSPPGPTTGMVFASGSRLLFEAGALLDASAGRVQLPGVLGQGYDSLRIAGVKATATASGITQALTTGTNPRAETFEVASGAVRYSWTTAAGNTNPLLYEPWHVPGDLATAAGLTIRMVASGATANATNSLTVRARNGTATAAIDTTFALAGGAAEITGTIASGSVPATGVLNFTVIPENAHASGNISLYSLGVSYTKRTS